MVAGTGSRFLQSVIAAVGLALPTAVSAQPETVALGIDGISAVTGEDSPGILYFLPWQPPTLPRRSRGALDTNAPELLEPIDPVVFERHQQFQQSLNPPRGPGLAPNPDTSNSLR